MRALPVAGCASRVADDIEARILLQTYGIAHGLVLDGAKLRRRDRTVVEAHARLAQRCRPEQAADHVGADFGQIGLQAGLVIAGAGGWGLVAGAGTGLGFLAEVGAEVGFALAVTAGAADTGTDQDETGAGAVSATVRTTGAGAGVEAGLAATVTAGEGAG